MKKQKLIFRKNKAILIYFLFLLFLLSGCELITSKSVPEDDWENQILWAEECGMDRLPCCVEEEQPCKYGQQCCYDPNNTKNTFCANDCTCGVEGNYCCASEPACGPDLICQDSFCIACGNNKQPCCEADKKCADGLVCGQNGCVECGLPGNPCCAGEEQCQGEERGDVKRTECQREKCVFCGSGGVACEKDPKCASGYLLNNDFCILCGKLNKPCCAASSISPDSRCDEDLVCELGFCTRPEIE